MRLAVLMGALTLALGVWAAEIRDLAWAELIPAGSPRLAQPMISHDGLTGEQGPLAPQQMPNAPVVKALDGLLVRLPGYMVPLETNPKGQVTEFLLVPYFGACIHVPPPPSNQIIHVRFPRGVVQEALFQPFWIEGLLQVAQTKSELAETGYSMSASQVYPYELESR